jgi:hypothetical protein|tara:strand:+ start:1636 stop:1836 length:201 start_codon:yes stop_codon:yes gene_type:complete
MRNFMAAFCLAIGGVMFLIGVWSVDLMETTIIADMVWRDWQVAIHAVFIPMTVGAMAIIAGAGVAK